MRHGDHAVAMMEECSLQLDNELRQSLQNELSSRRPLLHDLNQAWLIQLPRPTVAVRNGARFYYNLLMFKRIQPDEPAISVAKWDPVITGMEALVDGLRTHSFRGRRSNGTIDERSEAHSLIDAVVVTASDVSKKTLLGIHADVPIFTGAQAAKQINKWQCFRNVIVTPSFECQAGDLDWRISSLPPLPEWLGISWFSRDDADAALVVTFNSQHGNASAKLAKSAATTRGRSKQHNSTIEPDEDDETAEAFIYVSSVVGDQGLELITNASPTIRPLALLCDSQHAAVLPSSKQLTLLLLHAQRRLKVKYWVATKIEIKQRNGFLSRWFAPRTTLAAGELLNRALEHRKASGEHSRETNAVAGEVLEAFRDVEWLDSTDGMSRILH